MFVEINNYLRNFEKKSNINFLKLVTLAEKNKLSITCKYQFKNEFYYLEYHDSTNNFLLKKSNDSSKYYYGLHPKINENMILNAIKSKVFLNEKRFLAFANPLISYFTVDFTDVEVIKALYYKTLLQVASNFSFQIKSSKDQKVFFEEIVKGVLIQNVDYKFEKENDAYILHILGSINEEKIKFLDSNQIGFKIINGVITLSLDNSESFFKLFDFYQEELRTIGNFFYSGVLPRLKYIEEKKHLSSNTSLDIIILHIECTTYFTVNMMDYSYINNHQYLKKYKVYIEKLEKSEDELLQNTLFSNKEVNINLVNKYLSESKGTNIIAVTGNIFTKDGYYILTQRSKRAIDSEEIYPSVNGQSEIYDLNVELYNESVYEDLPSLKADGKSRIDFNNELNRESYSELYIKRFEYDWEYYGISVLGINNYGKENPTSRRLHFNVLAKNKASVNVLELSNNINNATERDENNDIYAIKINVFSNWFKYILSCFGVASRAILKWKSIALTPLSIALIILNLIDAKKNGTFMSLQNIDKTINLFILIIVFIISIFDFKSALEEYLKTRKVKRNIVVINDTNIFDKSDIIVKKVKKKVSKNSNINVTFHPITKLMLLLLQKK